MKRDAFGAGWYTVAPGATVIFDNRTYNEGQKIYVGNDALAKQWLNMGKLVAMSEKTTVRPQKMKGGRQ